MTELKDEGQKIIDELAAEAKKVNSLWPQYKPELIAIACLAAVAGLARGLLIMVPFVK